MLDQMKIGVNIESNKVFENISKRLKAWLE